MKKVLTVLLSLLLIVGVITGAMNYFQLQKPMKEVLSSDPRNEGVVVTVHYQRYFPSSVLVYDLKHVSVSKSKTDVFRVLLQYAEKMQDRDFNTIILCFQGTAKFILLGDYFRELGAEYDYQNPVYTMRTFPEHLFTPDGSQAYGKWTGGFIGVLGEQMDDFNDFHDRWYLNELLY